MRKVICTLVLGLFFIGFSQAQFKISDKPKFIPPVVDSIQLLTKDQYKSLYNKLKNYSDSTSTELFVAIISTTKGEDINYLAANWGEKWEIGQKGKDNGVILFMAKDDRKVAIQAGRGTEGKLTDLMAKRIIERRIIPEFQRGDFYKGLDRGTDGIFEVLTGEFQETRKRARKDKGTAAKIVGGIVTFVIFIVIMIIFIIFRGRGGGRGGGRRRRSGAGTLMDILILSSMGRGSYGGGSSSGGFGSGGSFGGGGASGSW